MTRSAPPRLTIFTPAWNRADLLPRLFHSIAGQVPANETRVEWLVIDDGSTDDTPAVLRGFIAKRPDLVRSLRVENGGKHRAINRAALVARGEWIMLVDSDDVVSEGAVRDVIQHIEKHGDDPRIGIIRGLKRFPDMNWKPYSFLKAGVPTYHWDWVSSQRIRDTAEVVRTAALALHPFPEHEGERFMAEGWLWHAIDTTHMLICFNRPWMNCWYHDGGLSANALRVRLNSLRGTMDVYKAISCSPAHWKVRARASINGWRYRFHAEARDIGRGYSLPWPFAPLGWLLYQRDRFLLRRQAS